MFKYKREQLVHYLVFCGQKSYKEAEEMKMQTSAVALLLLSSLALGAALGPAKTCSTGVAEEDPTAVHTPLELLCL